MRFLSRLLYDRQGRVLGAKACAAAIGCLALTLTTGCGRSERPSPYAKPPRVGVTTIRLPPITATGSSFLVSRTPKLPDVTAGQPVDFEITFTAADPQSVPPMVFVHWHRMIGGKADRVIVSSAGGMIEATETSGSVTAQGEAPRSTGPHQIVVFCGPHGEGSVTRSVIFPINVLLANMSKKQTK